MMRGCALTFVMVSHALLFSTPDRARSTSAVSSHSPTTGATHASLHVAQPSPDFLVNRLTPPHVTLWFLTVIIVKRHKTSPLDSV